MMIKHQIYTSSLPIAYCMLSTCTQKTAMMYIKSPGLCVTPHVADQFSLLQHFLALSLMPLVSVSFLFLVLEIRNTGSLCPRTWKAIAQHDAKINHSAPTSNAPRYSSGTNVPALSMQPTSILAACTYAFTCASTLSCQSKVSDPMHKLVSWNAVALAQPLKKCSLWPHDQWALS